MWISHSRRFFLLHQGVDIINLPLSISLHPDSDILSSSHSNSNMADSFNPSSVDLSTADLAQVVCYMTAGQNDYNGQLGARISALFVILIVSSATTFFPVIAARVKWVRINIYVYLFARYFGAGVIVATAFIQ